MLIKAAELMETTGITYRQIENWCDIGLISPVTETHPGPGQRRLFDSVDIPKIKTLVEIQKAFKHRLNGNILKKIYKNHSEGFLHLSDGVVLRWEIGPHRHYSSGWAASK